MIHFLTDSKKQLMYWTSVVIATHMIENITKLARYERKWDGNDDEESWELGIVNLHQGWNQMLILKSKVAKKVSFPFVS